MSEKPNLRNIWSIADKPLIDAMTKESRQSNSATAKYEREFSNSSDSAESSNESFAAVPEEFRPNLPPVLKEEKLKILDDQKQFVQNPNSVFRKYSNLPTKDPSNKNLSSASARYKQTRSSDKLPQNINFECTLMKSQCAQNQNSLTENCDSKIFSNTKCQNLHENGSQGKTKSTSVHSFDRSLKIGNRAVHRNTTLDEMQEKVPSPFPSQLQQGSALQSKPSRIKKQDNSVKHDYNKNTEPGIIKIDFEVPSQNDKNSDLKDRLQYNTKWSQNTEQQKVASVRKADSANFSGAKDNYIKTQHQVPVQESFIKWDTTLTINKQKDFDNNKIQWTVINEKVADVSVRKVFNDKKVICMPLKNENKYTKNSRNQVRKSQRENFQKTFSNSMQVENNFNPRNFYSNNNKLKHSESNPKGNKYNEESVSCQNNLQQMTDNLNCSGMKRRDIITELRMKKDGNFLGQCKASDINLTATKSKCQSFPDRVLNSSRENLLRDHIKEQKFNPKSNDLDHIRDENSQEKKDVLEYGREISDLIIGSHTALNMFISFYNEWKQSRNILIKHFEMLEKNLKESSKNYNKYSDIIEVANAGISIAKVVPHPYVSMAAQIVSLLTSLFKSFLKNPKQDEIKDSNDISASLLKDTQASTELYMYGLQCNQQFEETTKVIEKFHSKALQYNFLMDEDCEIATFVQGLLEYKPTHRIFYKKLHKCFQELLQSVTSPDGRRFCEPFTLISFTSQAVDVIGFLDWRFRYEDFSHESVQFELDQIHKLIQDSNTTSLKDLTERIQTCLRILREELAFVDKCLKDIRLFDSSSEQSVTKKLSY